MEQYIIRIEYAALVIMGLGLVTLFYNRKHTNKGIGKRVIQYTALVLALPILLILTLEKIISGETAATLIGTVMGYTLSSISNEDET